jgi:hypothetical protein
MFAPLKKSEYFRICSVFSLFIACAHSLRVKMSPRSFIRKKGKLKEGGERKRKKH